ncbi:MAG TPA: hypothetical protein VNF48_01805 [Gammaproteobacteria bacterium]|nr:hypothetical protein [Gammaproteobacteria bacterium]
MLDKFISIAIISLALSGAWNVARADSLWYPVAESNLIVVGTFEKYSLPDKSSYGQLQIQTHTLLKGEAGNRELQILYSWNRLLDPDLAVRLKNLAGKTVIAFVMIDSQKIDGQHRYYLTQDAGPMELVEDTPAMEDKVVTEVRLLSVQINRMQSAFHDIDQHDTAVKAAIEDLAALLAYRRERSLNALLKLGCTAVPSIIIHMDDHRPFHGVLQLQNNAAGASEASRSYAPKQVMDALAAILDQITGMSFRGIGNGQSDAQRRIEYQGWMSYLANYYAGGEPVSGAGSLACLH